MRKSQLRSLFGSTKGRCQKCQLSAPSSCTFSAVWDQAGRLAYRKICCCSSVVGFYSAGRSFSFFFPPEHKLVPKLMLHETSIGVSFRTVLNLNWTELKVRNVLTFLMPGKGNKDKGSCPHQDTPIFLTHSKQSVDLAYPHWCTGLMLKSCIYKTNSIQILHLHRLLECHHCATPFSYRCEHSGGVFKRYYKISI